MIFSTLFAKCSEWLFPACCVVCAKNLPGAEAVCAECHRTLPWNTQSCRRCALPIIAGMHCGPCLSDPPAFAECISPFIYQPPISTLIIQLKFQHELRYAKILGQLLAQAVSKQAHALPQCLIPVPLHRQRIRRRGFNQAVEIARPLSKAFQIPICNDFCFRRKNTQAQSHLSASARRRNMTGAFVICESKKQSFTHVAVVDDVMTTGQTVESLCRVLQSQGIKKIDVWCCARAA